MQKPVQCVLVITDSQGADIVGAYAGRDGGTSSLDRLVVERARFDRACSSCPLFTGTWRHTNGGWANEQPLGYIGRWHLAATAYFGDGKSPAGWDPEYWFDGRNHLDSLPDELRTFSREVHTSAEMEAAGFTVEHSTRTAALNARATSCAGTRRSRPLSSSRSTNRTTPSSRPAAGTNGSRSSRSIVDLRSRRSSPTSRSRTGGWRSTRAGCTAATAARFATLRTSAASLRRRRDRPPRRIDRRALSRRGGDGRDDRPLLRARVARPALGPGFRSREARKGHASRRRVRGDAARLQTGRPVR